jgi:sugar-specific transcriptional regulator TrmB
MKYLKRFWNWLLGQTTIDERIEEKVNNAKRTIVAVKEELKDVKEAIQDAVEDITEEVVDVKEAIKNGITIKGKVTKNKLNAIKKSDLIQYAKDTFGKEFDLKIAKSNLVNKIYGLHKNK